MVQINAKRYEQKLAIICLVLNLPRHNIWREHVLGNRNQSLLDVAESEKDGFVLLLHVACNISIEELMNRDRSCLILQSNSGDVGSAHFPLLSEKDGGIMR
jgi:hypothetical protein